MRNPTEFEDHFITTFTGKKFHYLDPQLDEVDIVDIAHALSLKCRFHGHCRLFYSVAEHSLRVAKIVPYSFGLEALLHDAAEAYMPDVARPIKVAFRLKEAENVILNVIHEKFRLNGNCSIVKFADNVLGATEARDLMPNTDDWARMPEPLVDKIHPMASKKVEKVFLNRFYEYWILLNWNTAPIYLRGSK